VTIKPWPGEWVDRAACVGRWDLFFPPVGGSPREAKLICRGCPVKDDCKEYAQDERFGVWAGKFREYSTRTRPSRANPVPIDPLVCPGVCGGTVFIPRNRDQKYHDQVCGDKSRYAARKAARHAQWIAAAESVAVAA